MSRSAERASWKTTMVCQAPAFAPPGGGIGGVLEAGADVGARGGPGGEETEEQTVGGASPSGEAEDAPIEGELRSLRSQDVDEEFGERLRPR